MKKEFKKGDLVKLREGLKVGDVYGELQYELLSQMVFDGFKEIEYVSKLGSLYIDGFYYRKEMLTK